MKDNVDFNIKFIQLVQERPCLYDYTRCDYNNKNYQDAAWMQIAKIVKESASDCKERWKNLRGCYTRHLKKRNKTTGISGKRIKPYYLSEHFSFLNNFTKTRADKTTTDDLQSDDNDSRESGTAPPTHSLAEKKEIYVENLGLYSTPNLSMKKPKQVFLNDVTATEMEYYPPAQDRPTPVTECQDPDFAFLYSMLPDMQEMNRDQKRKFKLGIIRLANEIMQENVPASSSSNS